MPIAVLSGPSHAEELARGLPASVVVSGAHEPLNDQIRDVLSHEAFRVYTSTDALGVELAGALKNILGIAAGICDGLGSGDNAKAALLTRGLVEIARLGVNLGARHRDVLRPGRRGRRRHDLLQSVSAAIARSASESAEARRSNRCSAEMVNVAEGVPTTRSVHVLARQRGVEMPITSELYQILFEGKPPRSGRGRSDGPAPQG